VTLNTSSSSTSKYGDWQTRDNRGVTFCFWAVLARAKEKGKLRGKGKRVGRRREKGTYPGGFTEGEPTLEVVENDLIGRVAS
jgi:hypothetical protein